MIRGSTRYVPGKERRTVCAELRKVYKAANKEDGARALDEFDKQVRKTISHDRAHLARPLGRSHALPRVPPIDPPRYLHDQRRRSPQPPVQEGPEDERPHAERRSRPQSSSTSISRPASTGSDRRPDGNTPPSSSQCTSMSDCLNEQRAARQMCVNPRGYSEASVMLKRNGGGALSLMSAEFWYARTPISPAPGACALKTATNSTSCPSWSSPW